MTPAHNRPVPTTIPIRSVHTRPRGNPDVDPEALRLGLAMLERVLGR